MLTKVELRVSLIYDTCELTRLRVAATLGLEQSEPGAGFSLSTPT
jgi:hypothetical protein